MLRRLYDWTLRLSESPRAPWALAGVSFAESSFFPIPPDVLLAPMALAKPQRAFFYATICTIASVAGGVAGWMIGHLLFDTLGLWLLNLYGYADRIPALKEFYAKWGAWFILIKGLTPIPYKLVTIVSGALDYNLILFIVLSIITRGARFFILAGIFNRWGTPLKGFLERHLGAIVMISLAIIVLGFWLAVKVI